MLVILLSYFLALKAQPVEDFADKADYVSVQFDNNRFMTSGGLPPRGGFDQDLDEQQRLDGGDRYLYPREDGYDGTQDVSKRYQVENADTRARLQSTNCPYPPSDEGCKRNFDWQCGQTQRLCGESCPTSSNPRVWDCLCDKDIEGNRFCWQNDYCSNLRSCSSTLSCRRQGLFNHRCVPDTCCGRNVCIRECEKPDCPADPYPDNQCPCTGAYWSCINWGNYGIPKRCGTVPNHPFFDCHCVPQEKSNPWTGVRDNNACVENDWCSAVASCNDDSDCQALGLLDHECIPNTCCRNRGKCLRCCRDPY